METSAIDALFLELSQITKATTQKELQQKSEIEPLKNALLKMNSEPSFLTNRADGVDGHYCLSRRNEDGYREHYCFMSDKWASFGSLIKLRMKRQ